MNRSRIFARRYPQLTLFSTLFAILCCSSIAALAQSEGVTATVMGQFSEPWALEFLPPVLSANPVVSPSSLMFYSGSHFPDWQDDAFISGLTFGTVSRIEFNTLDSSARLTRYTSAGLP